MRSLDGDAWRLTLRTAGSTSPITVNGGTLELSNATATPVTTGLITVGAKGIVTGTATVQSLSLGKGATTLCQLRASGNTCLTVKGGVKHDGDTILVAVPATRKLQVGDEITVGTVLKDRDQVELRSAASATAEVVTKAVRYQRFIVLQENVDDKWCKVDYKGEPAYLPLDSLEQETLCIKDLLL